MSKSNGCGPKWVPTVIKDLLFNWFFEASCDKHDANYKRGGTEEVRKYYDELFLGAMRRDALRKRGLQRLLRWSQVYVYYALVRIFGSWSFNYHDH